MSKRRQRDFFENDSALKPGRLAHGGELALKRRKIIRPLDPRRPVHITMRSTKAKGRYNFRNHQLAVKRIIARAVTGARKGKPFGRFWDLLAHTRVVTGLRDLRNVMDYVFINQIEGSFGAANGSIPADDPITTRGSGIDAAHRYFLKSPS